MPTAASQGAPPVAAGTGTRLLALGPEPCRSICKGTCASLVTCAFYFSPCSNRWNLEHPNDWSPPSAVGASSEVPLACGCSGCQPCAWREAGERQRHLHNRTCLGRLGASGVGKPALPAQRFSLPLPDPRLAAGSRTARGARKRGWRGGGGAAVGALSRMALARHRYGLQQHPPSPLPLPLLKQNRTLFGVGSCGVSLMCITAVAPV